VGRSFLVRIKLDTLRANLSAADGEAYTRADVRQWLLDAGFQPAGEWWRVNESGLLLDTVEVLEAMPEAEVRRKVRVA
jgi:hypothetical protein